MTFFRKSAIAAVAITALGVSSQAFAQKAGDIIGYVGGVLIKPNASISPLTSTDPYKTAALTNATASIDSSTTVTLGALYMWTDNIATELTLGIPPKMTVDVTTPAVTAAPSHPGAATAKVLNPSLVAKYLFNASNDTIRPYVGLGVTYTSFRDVTANTSNDSLVNSLAGTSASLSSSWAPIFNVGAIYNINDKWSINGSVSYVPLKSDVTFVGLNGATTTGTLTLNPWDVVVRVGYKF